MTRHPAFANAPVLALAFMFLSSAFIAADELGKTREALRSLKGSALFAKSLSAAVDASTSTADAIALLAEFSRQVDDPEQRKDFILKLAVFHELESSYILAAQRYEEAALLVPGKRDMSALLCAAACWIASGDGERAFELARGMETAGVSRAYVDRASLVMAWSSWMSGDTQAALDRAGKLMGGSERYGALVLASAVSAGSVREGYFSALEQEFGRPRDAGFPVYALLGNFRSGLDRDQGEKPASGDAEGSYHGGVSAPITPEVSTAVQDNGKKGDLPDGQYWLQVGAFREKDHAQALAERLHIAGFEPEISEKKNATGNLFMVMVPSGKDGERTLLGLKDKGFEAWPVF